MPIATAWGQGDVFLTILYIFCFVIWIWLLIAIFSDIFRSHDMNGGVKVIWIIFVILLPFIGIFVYLIARGGKMGQHAMEAAQAQDAANKAYIRDAAGSGGSAADELTRLADLKAKGVIDDAEFNSLKAKVVN